MVTQTGMITGFESTLNTISVAVKTALVCADQIKRLDGDDRDKMDAELRMGMVASMLNECYRMTDAARKITNE